MKAYSCRPSQVVHLQVGDYYGIVNISNIISTYYYL